jgi:hypothetical protein
VQTIIGLDHSKHCCGYAGLESHLSEQELAQYVDALVLDKEDELPQEVLEHVAECFECKVEIMEVLEIIESGGDSKNPSS